MKELQHLLNGATAIQTTFTVGLKAVEKDAGYVIRSAEQQRSWSCSGAELLQGVAVEMAQKTGDIWFYSKIKSETTGISR